MKQNAFGSLSAFIAITLLVSVSMVHAHPGHGPAESSAAHLLTSPDHLLLLLFTGICVGAAAVFLWRRAGTERRAEAGLARNSEPDANGSSRTSGSERAR